MKHTINAAVIFYHLDYWNPLVIYRYLFSQSVQTRMSIDPSLKADYVLWQRLACVGENSNMVIPANLSRVFGQRFSIFPTRDTLTSASLNEIDFSRSLRDGPDLDSTTAAYTFWKLWFYPNSLTKSEVAKKCELYREWKFEYSKWESESTKVFDHEKRRSLSAGIASTTSIDKHPLDCTIEGFFVRTVVFTVYVWYRLISTAHIHWDRFSWPRTR